MRTRARGVCGGDHRIVLTAMLGEVSRYWKTSALLATSVAAGAGLAWPVLLLHGRLVPPSTSGGDLGLVWRAGVQPVAAIQQQATDSLTGLLLGLAVATVAVAAATILVLALARESERAPELVVRRAVGAGRRVLLGGAAAEAGLVVAVGLVAGSSLTAGAAALSPPWPGSLRPGGAGLAGAAVLALAAVVLLGLLLPVLLPRRRVGVAEPRTPAPLAPSALQVAASLVALTAGSLLAGHVGRLAGPGGRPAIEGRISAIAMTRHAPQERAAHYASLLQRVKDESAGPVSLTSPGAVFGLGPTSMVTTDCGQCSEGNLRLPWRVKAATHQLVSADTFEMLGIRVLQGRALTDEDGWVAPRVAVINRSLAAREFQDGQALGRRIRVVDDGDRWSTVVGVVEDPPATGMGATLLPRYSVYLSVLQHPPARAELMTLGGPSGEPVQAVREAQAAPLAWFGARIREQGWAMLLVAVLGSMAVARLWVASLLVEFGVRRALGAPRRAIVRYVLARAAGVCGAGLALGIWFGAAVWGILGDLVPGLPAWDQAAVARFGVILLAGSLLGALPPAWRAARRAPASLLASA